MKSGIYKITNKENGKFYIGSSSNLKSRQLEHFRSLRKGSHHCKPLQRAFNKYGEASFKFEVLEYCEEKELINREQIFIDLEKPQYNCCKIAGRTTGYKHTYESKRQMSLKRRGKSFHTKEQVLAIKKAHKGKTVSKETRQKRARGVVQKTLKDKVVDVFYSISEATRVTGINNIACVLRGLQKKAGGFKWEYLKLKKEDRSLYKEREQRKKENLSKARIETGLKNRKAVVQVCLKTGKRLKTFSSMKEAELFFSKKVRGNISATINRKQKSAYGFGWKYK